MTYLKRFLPKSSYLLMPLLVIFLSVAEGKADVVGICAPDAPGQCSGSVNVTGNVVTITLTNTSPAINGGFITAAAFNFTAGTVVNNFTTTNANFALFGAAPSGWDGSVSPDADRTHLISATGNDYNGGGSPSDGTPTGASVTFTMTLAALNGNTEQSIFDSILIRQRGFEDGGSDKDSFLVPSPEPSQFGVVPTPEPTTMILLGTGLLGVAARIRKGRRKRLNS